MTENEDIAEPVIENSTGVEAIDSEATTSQNMISEVNEKDERSKQLSLKLQQAATSLVKCSNAMPKLGDGYELYASYSDYANFMKQQQIRLITSMRKIAAHIGCKAKISTSEFEDMEKIIIANDLLIERVGISFDEHQRQITNELLKTRKIAAKAEQISSNQTTDENGSLTAPFKRARLSSEVVSVSLNNNFETNMSKNLNKIKDQKDEKNLPHKKCGKTNGLTPQISTKQQNTVTQISVIQAETLVNEEFLQSPQTPVPISVNSQIFSEMETVENSSQKKTLVFVKDEREIEETYRVKEKVLEIYTRINKWATPFECYMVAIMRRQKGQKQANRVS